MIQEAHPVAPNKINTGRLHGPHDLERVRSSAFGKDVMRRLILSFGFALLAVPALAQTIQPTDVAAHVGQTVTVSGSVSQVHTSARSGVTFINMGGRYPDDAFTGVIFPEDASKFPAVGALSGKTVEITGPVRLHKGKPEIVLKDAVQLKSQ
jgi:hypothetical protein